MTISGTEPTPHAGNRQPIFSLIGFIALLAAAVEYARPFFGNQNQYYAHAAPGAALKSDWLINTTDPYPVFTGLARLLIQAAYPFGVVAAAYLFTGLALLAVYLFARKMAGPDADRRVSLLATMLVAATLATPTGYSLFNGFGGQYIVSKSAYFQPSSAGALIMLSLYLWLFKVEDSRVYHPWFLAAAALAVIGCVIHPTYLIAMAVALGVLAVVELVLSGRNRIVHYIAVGLLIVVVLSVTAPGVFGIGNPGAEFSAALDRFAYERIPGHTLWWRWDRINVVFPPIVLGGIYAAVRWHRQDALALWLLGCLTISVAAVLVLPMLPSGRFLLMFPWRLSVCLVPIAGTALACALAKWLMSRWNIRSWMLGAAALGLAVLGISRTATNWDAADRDPAVALLRQEHPAGVGIIPTNQELLRLNVPVAVYIDWKSPPYASNDLAEWWRRNDRVKALDSDPGLLCRDDWAQPIAWRLAPLDAPPLPCPDQWKVKARNEAWQLLVRTTPKKP